MNSVINNLSQGVQQVYGPTAYLDPKATSPLVASAVDTIAKKLNLTERTKEQILHIHNIALNILGYVPGICVISGSIRMLEGAATCAVGLVGILADKNVKRALDQEKTRQYFATEFARIGRGALEAFVPFGQVVNLAIDAGLWLSRK